MEYSVNFYCNLLQEPENFYPAELPEFVDLLNDQGFKHVFGRDANKDILIALLNEIIPDRVIVDLRHIRNEQIPSDPETKGSVFDLYCETEDGSRIVVELQNKPQHLNSPRIWMIFLPTICRKYSSTASKTCTGTKSSLKHSNNLYATGSLKRHGLQP